MKVLKEVKKQPKPWSHKAKCGPVENAPPVDGCGTEVELTINDIFHKEIRTPQMVGRSFHWRCPICQVTNFIPFTIMPTHEVPSQKNYLEVLRKNTMIEIARLHPVFERSNIISTLGDDFFLDDDIVSSLLTDKLLYS